MWSRGNFGLILFECLQNVLNHNKIPLPQEPDDFSATAESLGWFLSAPYSQLSAKK